MGSAVNVLKTTMLLATLTAIFMGIGHLIGGESGALAALGVAAVMNFVSDRNADRVVPMSAERNPASAHLFIVNPLSGARMDNLFSTHPDTVNRIAALQQMVRELGTHSSGTAARLGSRTSQAVDGPWSRPRGAHRAVRGFWG